MDLIFEGLREAWRLLSTGDGDIYDITLRTAYITGTSTLVALMIGMPVGLALALTRFPGQRGVVALANAGTGTPPVVAGLFVAILLWRSGPLGGLGLIYTPAAIVIAQALIATPIIVAITAAAVMALPPTLHLQVRSMGANQHQYLWLIAARSSAAAPCRRDGRLRRRRFRGGRVDDGRRQSLGRNTGADHCCRT